jgi:hypothetical protein
MFYLCSLKLYQWVINEIDKYRRHCLWRDKDLQKKNPPLAAWDLVCRPKDQGGLGVLNLSVQNDCLLMKHLNKFYNHADIPWVNLCWEFYYSTALPPARPMEISFWWRDCLKMLPTFKQVATCDFVQGNSILLWKDKWATQTLQVTWPQLFSFVNNESISIQDALQYADISDLLYLPVSEEAMIQMNLFQAMLQSLVPTDGSDSWTIFGSNKTYKVSRMYKNMMQNNGAIPALEWMWKSCCQQKHKVFFWLLTHDRLNTRAMLQRKRFFLPDYSCVMCGSHLETRDHLFFECPFATMCWQYLCPSWSLQPGSALDFQQSITNLKNFIDKPFFMEIIVLVT